MALTLIKPVDLFTKDKRPKNSFRNFSLGILVVTFSLVFAHASAQVQLVHINQTSSSHCRGVSTDWHLVVVFGNWRITDASASTTQGGGSPSKWSGEYKWSVIWASSATLTVEYWLENDSQFPTQYVHSSISIPFSVEGVPGTVTGPGSICSGSSVNLSVSGNSGPVTYQRLVGGTVVAEQSSATFDNIQQTSQFRTRITSQYCSDGYSDPITVNITPNVQITSNLSLNSGSGLWASCTPFSTASIQANNVSGGYTWGIASNPPGGNPGHFIGNPTGTSATIEWEPSFIGGAKITVTANGCAPQTQEYLVQLYNSPTALFRALSPQNDNEGCKNESADYQLVMTDPNLIITYASFETLYGGSAPSDIGTNLRRVTWSSDGAIRATYTIERSDHSCTWSNVQSTVNFNVIEVDAGTITPSASAVCVGEDVSFTLQGNTHNVTWQQCYLGCPPQGEQGWQDFTGPTWPDLEQSSQFRTKVTTTNCGTDYSDVVFVTGRFRPEITASDKNVFSTQALGLEASPSISTATVHWSVSASGVNISPTSGDGSSINPTVTTSGPSDGTLDFTISASFLGCPGPEKTVHVNVYVKPEISVTNAPIRKGSPDPVLTTSPVFQTGTWYRDGSPVSTQPSIATRIGGLYKATVTKGGATIDTDAYRLSGAAGQDLNYIITDIANVPGITDPATISDLSVDDAAQSIEYFDGLGRSMQIVNTAASPAKKDVIQPKWYDKLGKQPYTYLPYVDGDDGTYKSGTVTPTTGLPTGRALSFYNDQADDKIVNDPKPYAKTEFEFSPLNRVLETRGPGEAWQGHVGVKKDYSFNVALEILKFGYASGLPTLGSGSARYYGANTLVCNKTTDEEGNEVSEFLDTLGKTICKKVKVSATESAFTYYVYDDLGRLVIVIPPEGIKSILATLH